MASLKDLVNNLSTFRYYSGLGTFDANALPYGKDRPNGGSSKQPYVVNPIGQRWSPFNSDDGILPFGFLATSTRSFYDVIRLGKFFTDLPKGPLWLVKQTGLQRMNPKIQLGDYKTNSPVNFIQKEIGDTRLYNPLGTNTLAQAGANGFGIHFTRHGLFPTIETKNAYAKQNPDNNTKFQGLRDRFAANPGSYNQKSQRLISEYSGGPDSYLGIGKTQIFRVANKSIDDSFAAGYTPLNAGFASIPLKSLFNIVSSNDVLTELQSNGTNTITNTFDFFNEDFRKYKNKTLGLTNLTYSEYNNSKIGNVEKRIGVIKTRNGTKRSPDIKGSPNYWDPSPSTDAVNMVSLYRADAPGDFTEATDINGNPVDTTVIRDAIKFRIKSFDNDRPGENGIYMVFRAFLTSLSDGMNATWTPYSYVGRGENFYLYDGFTADINLGFKVVALSRDEMKPLYQKMNYLKSCMTPDYTRSGKMRGNVMELTVGDYIRYQPGLITSLTYTLPQDVNWEIAIDYLGNDKDMHELPQMIDVNLTFTPIYKFLPRKTYEQSYIGISDYRREYDQKTNKVGDVTASPARDWTYVGYKYNSSGSLESVGTTGKLIRI